MKKDIFQELWDLSPQEEEATLSLDSIPFQLSLADIYDKVEFEIENQQCFSMSLVIGHLTND